MTRRTEVRANRGRPGGVERERSPSASPRLARVPAFRRQRPWWRRRTRTSENSTVEPSTEALRLPTLLAPDGLVMWDAPVSREEAVGALVDLVVPAVPGLTAATALRRLAERDALGPTHIGEGVDLPHARLDEVGRSVFAIGLTRGGVEDVEAPTEVVWLLLLPPGGTGLRTTAQVARACRDDAFRAALRSAHDAAAVRAALARWERSHEAPPGGWTS